MRDVEVDKARLVEALTTNRRTHTADFELAWDGFVVKARENVEAILDELKKAPRGKAPQLHIGLAPPQDHTIDYDRALEMCDWELGETVTLTEEEFQQFVQDDWNWKHAFSLSNQLYTGSPSPSRA